MVGKTRADRPLQARDGPKRILVVSDSLGTPIHPRGIFYYTTNLMRALKSCGHDLTLLVETSEDHTARARRTPELDSIYQYLATKEFAGLPAARPARWTAHLPPGFLPRARPLLSPRGVALSLHVSNTLRPRPVAKRAASEIPEGLDHLGLVSEFLTCREIYTRSRAASIFGLQIQTIDARGFDFVLVDTPTYLRFAVSPGARVVGVIHDLIPITDDSIPEGARRSFRNNLCATLGAATDLVYVSQSTRELVRTMFRDAVRGKKEAILHPTIPEEIAPMQQPADVLTAGGDGYFVAILSDEVRKNLATLVRALVLFPAGIRLKVIGYFPEARQASLAAIDPRVEFLGYVSDTKKKETLAGSLGLIMPSLFEGFGIPLIEAAFHGKPVFCSDISVFREVMGENAFYFDPHLPASIASCIRTYVDEPAKHHARIAGARTECLRRFGLQALTDAAAAHFGRGGSPRNEGGA
jgi:glycosyltransferase involved in cell wall biosynthesis